MKILKTYHFNVAWYAQVELDDKSRVELKLRQDKQPAEADILKLANDYQIAITDANRAEADASKAAQEKAARVTDKETGAEIGKLTVGAFSKILSDRLKARPEAGSVLMADVLKVGA